VVTHWSVPYQVLSSSCYHDLYQQGSGEDQDEVRMPARKLVVFAYPHSTPSLSPGSWQLFHPGKAFGHELLDRTGSETNYDKPGNCGAGGGGPTTTTGPYDCGTRSGDPQISILAPRQGRRHDQLLHRRHDGQLDPHPHASLAARDAGKSTNAHATGASAAFAVGD
jgi:hypothetical protein